MKEQDKKPVGRPKKSDTENYKRATFIVRRDNLEKLKAVAWYKRWKGDKDAINKILDFYFNQLDVTELNQAINEYNKENN